MNDEPAAAPSIHVRSYDARELEQERTDMTQALRLIGKRKVAWLCVSGPPGADTFRQLGEHLSIDPYEIRSIIEHSKGRAKLEDFGNALFLSWSTPVQDHDGVEAHPAYFILGTDYLISFQDGEGHYKEIIDRLGNEHSRLRKSGPDYLLFALLSEITEEFFDHVEELSDDLDRLEDRLITSTEREVLQDVRMMREHISTVWRSVWPLREAADSLAERDIGVIRAQNHTYFHEVSDSLELLLHEVEGLNQIIPQLIDLYETSTSNQLNQIVKVLTVFSVVFAPLTLIAGIYGMNFQNLPGLGHSLGYSLALALMAAVAVSMLGLFYLKGWIFAGKKRA